MMNITDDTICIVSFPEVWVYDFYPTREAAEEDIPNRIAASKADAALYESYVGQFEHVTPNYWADRAKREREKEFKVMTLVEYEKAQADKYLERPLTRITEEGWHEMLDILPPLKWGHRDGFESFFMSEFETGTYTTQYAKNDSGCFKKVVDITRPETWIQLTMIENAVA